ncbi:DUF2783 domain-containing protein [Thalassobius vesicularis]|uniref:DUF2783 domain-containing protein n=1 Tax=Thalassobius vesicularis TaxID=1294297 RepID=A0A4S3M870_9RHOB|nr:DUF2783 domain-containing protein [Thalassobius vesicularis]THD72856.1 DUF2783 domain-containing protein [Thalassobius vesicularis]
MTHSDLETIYEALAQGIDTAGEHAPVYLAKVALALAETLNDAPAALKIIADAQANLTR